MSNQMPPPAHVPHDSDEAPLNPVEGKGTSPVPPNPEVTTAAYPWGNYDFSARSIQLLDTSLRDGLQDVEIKHPTLDEKLRFLHALLEVGVDAVDVGIPVGRGTRLDDAVRLARELPEQVQPVCLARTQEADVQAAAELAQRAGRPIEVIVFVGSSPLRRWVEGWALEEMIRWLEHSVTLAVSEGLKATISTEHTTETEPDVIRQLFRVGLERGGQRVCIADTSGVATHHSVATLIGFFKEQVLRGFGDVEIDWHGHNDLGLAVPNALTAIEASAARVHTTVLGVGERAGNIPIESLLLNLKIAGDPRHQDLRGIPALSRLGSTIFDVPIAVNTPGIGRKVGVTASGIHAAAMLKARKLGIEAGLPYSAVDQRWFDREADVRIGPLSGRANVEWVAGKLGIPCTEELVERSLAAAMEMNRLLTDADFINLANAPDVQRSPQPDTISSGERAGGVVLPPGSRSESIPLSDGVVKTVPVLSFRDRRHLRPIAKMLLDDDPVAFHGWGVSGVCGRVDAASGFQKFWILKSGRPPGSKIPLLEPPEEIVRHVDWEAVHPAYRYLRDPNRLKKVWKGAVPFHLIFPYNAKGSSLSDAVVTPAFDPEVAPRTPAPTACFFWIDDPSLVRLVREVKAKDVTVQLGVSSLNDPGQIPPFNTEELLGYLKERRIGRYAFVVEDPVVEPLDIASSHSQFVVPLDGEEPVWTVKRIGSLSPAAFARRTGFRVAVPEAVRVAARRAPVEANLDALVEECARRIGRWRYRAMLRWPL